MTFYNDFDPAICNWLEELIALKLISPGTIDRRSITDLKPHELKTYKRLHFFAGVAGWEQALNLIGFPRDRSVWSASLPCQPWSGAGQQKGADDSRNLWPSFFGLVRELGPELIVGEQVPAAIPLGWLDGISTDLETEGYTVRSIVLPACGVGSPQRRQRIFWMASTQNAHRGWKFEESGKGLRWTGSPGGGEPVLALGGADSNGRSPGNRTSKGPRHRDTALPAGGDVLGVVNSHEPGLQISQKNGKHPGPTTESESSGDGFFRMVQPDDARGCSRPARSEDETDAGKPGQSNHWDHFDICHFTDGKIRRIEPGTLPMAPGLPKRMVPGRDPCLQEIQNTSEARKLRLHGYGNSIVPEVAARFLIAAIQSLHDDKP